MKQPFFVSIYHAPGDKPNPDSVHLRNNPEYSGEEIVLTENAVLVLAVLLDSSGIKVVLEKIAQAGFRLGQKKALESREPETVETS